MNCKKSLSNITFFDDGLGSHIEDGEVDCETLFVNGVQITTNGGGGGSVPSISYVAGPPSTTTITGNTILQNLNGFTSANLTNALNQTVSLTSPAQTQLTALQVKTTDLSNNLTTANTNITSLQVKTTNQSFSGTQTSFTGQTNFNGLVNILTGRQIQLQGTAQLSMSATSLISANGVILTATELSYLDNASSNIQTQINNANSAISNNDTDITNIQDDIADINTHLGALDAGLASVGAALIATDLVVASNTGAISAIVAEQIIQNGYISDHATNLATLNFKTTRMSYASGAGGVPDTTTFNSDLVCNQLKTNTISPEAGNSLLFAISATGTFQNNLEVQGSFNQTGIVGTISNSFGGATTFNNTTNFNGNTKFNTSASNPTAIFDTPVSLNAVTNFNGKSVTFYKENPPFPAQTKAIVSSYQPLILYDGMEITGDIRMYDGYKLIVNKIVPNAIIGVDTLTLGSALATGTELVKVSSNMTIDSTYTFTNNGITALNGDVGIGGVALNKNLTIACDDINSYAITALYDANALNIGTQANCGTCEIATNTGITLRTDTLNVIANTTNISNNVLCGDPTQTTPTTLTSYGQFFLKSGFTLYENITSTFKDSIIYAEKLAGASSDFIGTLNMVARRFIYTNINEIFYRTSFATGFNDVAITITPVYGVQHGGSYKIQSAIQDLESPIIYIGKDANSVVECRGTFICENIQSADGRIDMPDDIFAQF